MSVTLFVAELDGDTFPTRADAGEYYDEHAEYVSLAYAESGGALNLPQPVWDPYGERQIWSHEYWCWMERDPYRGT